MNIKVGEANGIEIFIPRDENTLEDHLGFIHLDKDEVEHYHD